MMGIQSQLKQKFFNKRSGGIFWILSWPFVSLLFDAHPHFPAFLTPIALLWLLGALLLSLDESDFLLLKEVDDWSFFLKK